MLGACEGETPGTTDCIRLPDGVYDGSDCPIGAALAAVDRVEWWSSGYWQGSVGSYDNECASKGNCGLPWSTTNIGGGWQICFV